MLKIVTDAMQPLNGTGSEAKGRRQQYQTVFLFENNGKYGSKAVGIDATDCCAKKCSMSTVWHCNEFSLDRYFSTG